MRLQTCRTTTLRVSGPYSVRCAFATRWKCVCVWVQNFFTDSICDKMKKLLFLYICVAVFIQPIISFGVPQKEDDSFVRFEKALSSYICNNCMSKRETKKECKKIYKTCSSYKRNYNVFGEYDRIIAHHVCGYCYEHEFASTWCSDLQDKCYRFSIGQLLDIYLKGI